MGRIFKNQTALKVQIETGVDLTSATKKIKYKKPDGSLGEFSTGIADINLTEGIIEWTPADANSLDQAGTWTMWVHITFSGGSVAAGEVFCIEVNQEGEQ